MTADVPVSPETGQLIALRRAARGLSFDPYTGLFHASRPVPDYLVPAIRALLAAGALRIVDGRVLVTTAGQALRDQLDARRRTLMTAERGKPRGQLREADDLPSPLDVRPFLMAMTTEDPLPHRPGLRYDPMRQLTVDASGEPVVTTPWFAEHRLTDRD